MTFHLSPKWYCAFFLTPWSSSWCRRSAIWFSYPVSLQRRNARSSECTRVCFYSTCHPMDRIELCMLRAAMTLSPWHALSLRQNRFLLSEGCTQLRMHMDTAPQHPSSSRQTDFTVRQRRHHLTFASYLQDRHILTSVIFQGCFVFTMVLFRQLWIKHIPYLCRINTMRQDIVLVHFPCKAWEISVQNGRHCRVYKLQRMLFCSSGCIVPLV